MLIHVNLCTHRRPLGLVGVIMSFQRMRSMAHDVRFRIGIDEDDQVSLDAASNLEAECPIDVICGPCPIARGEIENRLMRGSAEADVVTMLTDRTFCITPGWDDALAKGVTEQPKRLTWWMCPEDNGCVMPIIPKAWREASEHNWSPEVFPFWFDDTWNQQIDLLIYGLPSLKVMVNYSGHRSKTKRARDFAFWITLFNEMLPIRVEVAKAMAGKMGAEFKMRPDVMEYITKHYRALMENIPKLEEMFADADEPGPEYIEAKRRADGLFAEMMKQMPAAEAAE